MAGQVRHLKVKGGRFYARIAVPEGGSGDPGEDGAGRAIGGNRREAVRALPA